MAVVTAPLLSFGASGQIAKSMVNAKWRGVNYARRYVVPANPNTAAQQETRSVFAFLSEVWKNGSSDMQAPWTAAATGQKYYNRNVFMGKNTAILRPGDDMTGFLGSPGAGGGLAPASVTAEAGDDSLTVTVTPPPLPNGWTVSKVVALALPNTDPHTATVFTSASGNASASPWEVTLTGLTAAAHIVSGWVVYSKPDGSLAYGPSLNTTGTPT